MKIDQFFIKDHSSRSLASEAVSRDEIGRVFSINALIGAVNSSLTAALFEKIYNLTLDTLPGAYLLVVFGLVILIVPIMFVLKRLGKSFVESPN